MGIRCTLLYIQPFYIKYLCKKNLRVHNNALVLWHCKNIPQGTKQVLEIYRKHDISTSPNFTTHRLSKNNIEDKDIFGNKYTDWCHQPKYAFQTMTF